MHRHKLACGLLSLVPLLTSGCSLLSTDLFQFRQQELNQSLHKIQQLDFSREGIGRAMQWAYPKGYDILMGQAMEQAACEDLRLGAHLACVRQFEKPYSVYVLEREQVLHDGAMLREARQLQAESRYRSPLSASESKIP